jgi:endonuclease YncB( thermonuclease family)
MLRIILATTLLSLTATSMARADPCEGRLPTRHGETFAGTVRYVGDGDSLCVGRTSNPNDWIEVRLADFDAPELRERDGRRSRDILTRLTRGRQVNCTATRGRSGRVVSYDRVIATCRLGRQRLGDLLRAQRAPEGGN